MSGSKEAPSCCRWCTSFISTLGLTVLFMWLSLRPKSPTLSIEEIYIPALNKAANDTSNTTISFDLKLNNGNKDSRIYYDALNLTLYYGRNLTSPIGNVTIPAFRQGHRKNTHRREMVNVTGVPWKTALGEVSNGTAVFRVDLLTKVRYKVVFWMTKRYQLKVGGNVTVNDQGLKSEKKGVKLSCAVAQVSSYVRLGFFILSVWALFY